MKTDLVVKLVYKGDTTPDACTVTNPDWRDTKDGEIMTTGFDGERWYNEIWCEKEGKSKRVYISGH